jgi:hypothetical protein
MTYETLGPLPSMKDQAGNKGAKIILKYLNEVEKVHLVRMTQNQARDSNEGRNKTKSLLESFTDFQQTPKISKGGSSGIFEYNQQIKEDQSFMTRWLNLFKNEEDDNNENFDFNMEKKGDTRYYFKGKEFEFSNVFFQQFAQHNRLRFIDYQITVYDPLVILDLSIIKYMMNTIKPRSSRPSFS